jgi:hypothetical protein
MRNGLPLLVIAITVVLVAASLQARADSDRRMVFDPPTLRFVGSIGSVRLGMTRDAVEYLYGDTNQGRLQIRDDYFPPGTKHEGVPLFVMTYRLHGGVLRVKYVHDRVKVIETTSRYYRTLRGVGAGTRIPLGPCHRNRFGSCEYRWRGFFYEADCGKAWIHGTRHRQTDLFMRHGRVWQVQIGDPDVILYCF